MRAWQAGVRRQRVELLLPLIGATDLDDWPGGVRQQFKAVLPMCAVDSLTLSGGMICFNACVRLWPASQGQAQDVATAKP